MWVSQKHYSYPQLFLFPEILNPPWWICQLSKCVFSVCECVCVCRNANVSMRISVRGEVKPIDQTKTERRTFCSILPTHTYLLA